MWAYIYMLVAVRGLTTWNNIVYIMISMTSEGSSVVHLWKLCFWPCANSKHDISEAA